MAAPRHPLHSMCSYLGCFPPHVPRRVIERVLPRRGVVLDPFCGSGTTLVEAVRAGHTAIGLDLNPLAVALSRAKMQHVVKSDVLARVRELAGGFRARRDLDLVPEAVRIIYHPRTLGQLVYLRETLDDSIQEDAFIQGVLLGIMHGKFRKGGGTAYLSIDMPNTFSMSPEYVRKFVAKHGLTQPPVDVFTKLVERIEYLLRNDALPASESRVERGDATQIQVALSRMDVTRVDAIVTSPPYLGVLRYGAFNWIRLWFLGHEPAPIDRLLDGTDSLDRYLSFVMSFLCAAADVIREGTPVAMVIGDVHEFGTQLKLAERVWEELSEVVPFELEGIEADNFDERSKTTRIWGETRKGRATPLDRVLLLRRAKIARSARGRDRARHSSASL